MEISKKASPISLIDLVEISMIAAITCVATLVIRVPSLTGYTHIGDSMIFIGVILLGKKNGVISGALGMFLADLLGGYLIWAPFTLFIKAVMALIVGIIAFRKDYNGKNIMNNTVAFIMGGTWMVVAYLFFGVFVTRITVAAADTLYKGLLISLKDVPGNIMQAVIGLALAVPITILLNKTNIRKR